MVLENGVVVDQSVGSAVIGYAATNQEIGLLLGLQKLSVRDFLVGSVLELEQRVLSLLFAAEKINAKVWLLNLNDTLKRADDAFEILGI